MKCLLVTLEYPPMIGGVANYLAGICNNINNIYVLRVGLSRFLRPKWIFIFFDVIKVLREEKIKMIMISHVLPIGYIALIFKNFFGISYIVFTHGMDILLPQSHGWKSFWLKKILKNANLIIANSDFTRRKLLELNIKNDKIEIIYPCPNFNIKNVQFQKDFPDQKMILTVGRLVKRKGIDKVIEAMPKVLKKFPSLVYMIVGDGPYKKELIELKEKNRLNNKVIFVSGVSDDEIHVYYGMSDIFVMPSRKIGPDVEGFGIVYLEAALFEKPSVAGIEGGAPEAVINNETGLVVDGESIDEISEAIIKLLRDDELRKEMGLRAKQRVLEKFTYKKQVEKLKDMISPIGL